MRHADSREPSSAFLTLEFKCLGTFAFAAAGGWRNGPARARGGGFLEYIATHPHAAVSRQSLCEVLWPQSDAGESAHKLHLAASGARAAVRSACGAINPIVFSDGAYAWHPAIRVTRDTDVFEACFADGSPEALTRATSLYVGEFLAGASADWILPLRVRYEHLYVTMIERLAFEAYRRGDFAGATSLALDLVAVDRAHERATQLAMVCLAKSGRRGLAVREYERLRDYLHAWLGVAPTAETGRLLAQIIDGSLDALQL